MITLYILMALLAVSVFANYVQYQQKLDLRERLYETADWIDPVALATLNEEERRERLSLLPVYTVQFTKRRARRSPEANHV